MLNSSLKESATMDELAHIPSGYSYVKYLDYRLNPEHPPLVKALSALPLLFQDLNFPKNKSAWQNEVNGQWEAGAQFLYESNNNADKIIQWSRLGPMFLTLILLLFIYIWSKELIGRWWALLPTFLFSISPTVLSHGHYVTTDLGAALGIFISSYYFVKFLLQPNYKHLIFAGIAFGIAQLMKFSTVLLLPFFGFLILVFCLWQIKTKQANLIKKTRTFLKIFFKHILYLIGIVIIGYFVVYSVYFIFTLNYPIEKQKSDTEFILASFAGGPIQNIENNTKEQNPLILSCINFPSIRCPAEINIWLTENKILRPIGQYLLGVLMVFQRSSGGNTGYFLGEVSASGWWYYFPTVFVLKESLPSLILIFLALILALWKILKKFKNKILNIKQSFWDYLATHFAEFSMLVFIIFYWAYSIKSPLNIGVRHILPTIPFIYILTASSLKKWLNEKIRLPNGFFKKISSSLIIISKFALKGGIIGILIFWCFAESLIVYPHFLSYFNQLAGGTNNGYQYATDSNYDWGQDLLRLKNFIDNPPTGEEKIEKIAIDYFGGGNPKYYLQDKVEYWWSSKGNPIKDEIKWLAVSINTIQGALGKLHPGQERKPEDEYEWLTKIKNPYEPDYKAGKSIFIYKLQN
ncbi:phospholipid carrier-dependent glycosyltransferase [Candidatus Wolfebacteria bacterium]|nr:phospholipid carrier-dependent glycosyltransferase [Candidatus Wolfebacteria bacterium]